MTAIASPEFVSLCQAQLQLLTQQMSGSSAAVYIADVMGQMSDSPWAKQRTEPDFVPVVSYPESLDYWVDHFARATSWASGESGPLALLPGSPQGAGSPRESAGPELEGVAYESQAADLRSAGSSSASAWPTDSQAAEARPKSWDAYGERWSNPMQPERQLVVPLVYADVVVGLMIAIRRDRAWESEERHYVESVGQSLAAGCVLERRSQWLQTQIADKRDLHGRQSEIFHNLLHQFRNPLTAVSTFGQLLVRRLEPEDPNQKVATGIVRESKRLREMVAHFDETVAIGDAELAREPNTLSLPAAPTRLLPSSESRLPADPTAPLNESADEGFGATNSMSDADMDSTAALATAGLADDGLRTAAVNEAMDDLASASGAVLGHSLVLSAQYLPEIVEPILAVSSIVAMEKGVAIQAHVAADTPAVWGEEEALGEVVSNLVDNAVKYSPAGAQVVVHTGVSHVSETHYYQGIVVGDTGPGIPADDLARLFERNYRGVQAESDIPGTGLGLAIARSLMAQMQGFIEVVSPAIGTPWMPPSLLENAASQGPGTVFIVWLREADTPLNGALQK
ncbi:MAG: sensor histidine kinase [Cyanobacteria bacterium P01_D01_bin.36]